ncbi:MAG: hypothetical protein KME43_14755, partial [Myxacorys chilensis ATA2-1-KO14]|nr:hypothetical protein [Myxacorys chilensis ATA2-1-KO14]
MENSRPCMSVATGRLAVKGKLIQSELMCDRKTDYPLLQILGCVDISAKFNQQGSEINKAEKILRFLLKTRKDAAKVLELVK